MKAGDEKKKKKTLQRGLGKAYCDMFFFFFRSTDLGLKLLRLLKENNPDKRCKKKKRKKVFVRTNIVLNKAQIITLPLKSNSG